MSRLSDLFPKFAKKTSHLAGHPAAFLISVLVVISWAASGHFFHYSDTWQLVINTGTTIITFLMVFLIQNTQNRDATATQLKLDELIRASSHARNKLIDLEELSDEELEILHKEFCALKDHYSQKAENIDDAKKKKRSSKRKN